MSESELVAGPAAGSPMWNPRGRWTWFDGECLVSQARSGQIRMGMGRLAGRGGGGHWSGKFREEHGESRSNPPCLLFVSAGLIDERSWGSTATSTQYTVPHSHRHRYAGVHCIARLSHQPRSHTPAARDHWRQVARSLVPDLDSWIRTTVQAWQRMGMAWHGMAGIGESGIQGAEGE